MLEKLVRASVLLAALVLLAPAGSAGIPVDDTVDETQQAVRDLQNQLPNPNGAPDDGALPPNSPPTTPEDPLVDPTEANKTIRDASAQAEALIAEARRELAGILPADPLDYLDRHLRPVRDTASQVQYDILGHAEAEPEEQSNVGVASISSVEMPREQILMMAGATAAAAAIALLWLAGSSGSLGASAAGSAGGKVAISQELRRLLPFASPMFTRFEKDNVLGHPKREALYALILQTPGISLQSLCDATGLSRTAVTHHLRLLEMQHLVVSKRLGRSRHYFENGGRFGRDQKEALAVLQNDRSKEVASFVKDHPGAIQKVLCQALGLQPSIAHWHLTRLQQAQLVESVRSGRTVAYFPAAAMRSIDAPVIPAGALVSPITAS